MSKNRVSPLSTSNIRLYANRLRQLFGFKPNEPIKVAKLFDRFSVIFDDSDCQFDYEVLPDNDSAFVDKEEAFTDLLSGKIFIKESVMDQACRRLFKRGQFTLTHEIGHYLLHYLQEDVKLTRVSDDIDVPIYCDPEWQADCFASEFLMPFDCCCDMDIEQIRKTYHVSRQAAEVRYKKIQLELNKKGERN